MNNNLLNYNLYIQAAKKNTFSLIYNSKIICFFIINYLYNYFYTGFTDIQNNNAILNPISFPTSNKKIINRNYSIFIPHKIIFYKNKQILFFYLIFFTILLFCIMKYVNLK